MDGKADALPLMGTLQRYMFLIFTRCNAFVHLIVAVPSLTVTVPLPMLFLTVPIPPVLVVLASFAYLHL